MLPLLFLLAAADPSPSLQAIVALGRGGVVAPPTTTTTATTATTTATTAAPALPEPTPALSSSATTPLTPLTTTTTTAPSLAPPPTTFSPLPKAEEPSPWAGVALLVALGGGAFGLWWKKRGAPQASRLLHLQESVSVGKGRALIVADVDGRRVLLASSEAGVSLLLDLGRTPTAPAPSLVDDAFGEALAKEMNPVTVSGGTVDVEGHEIQRRIERARRAA